MFKSRMLLLFSFVLVFAQPVQGFDAALKGVDGFLESADKSIIQNKLAGSLANKAKCVIAQPIIQYVMYGRNNGFSNSISLSIDDCIQPFCFALLYSIPGVEPLMHNYGMSNKNIEKVFLNSGLSKILPDAQQLPYGKKPFTLEQHDELNTQRSALERELRDSNRWVEGLQITINEGLPQYFNLKDQLPVLATNFALRTIPCAVLHFATAFCLRSCEDLPFWIGKSSSGLMNAGLSKIIGHHSYIVGATAFLINQTVAIADVVENKNDPSLQGLVPLLIGELQTCYDQTWSGLLFAKILATAGTLCFGWTIPVLGTWSYVTLVGSTMGARGIYKWLCDVKNLTQEEKKIEFNKRKQVFAHYVKFDFAQTMIVNSIDLAKKSVIPVTCFAAACLIMPYMQTAPAA